MICTLEHRYCLYKVSWTLDLFWPNCLNNGLVEFCWLLLWIDSFDAGISEIIYSIFIYFNPVGPLDGFFAIYSCEIMLLHSFFLSCYFSCSFSDRRKTPDLLPDANLFLSSILATKSWCWLANLACSSTSRDSDVGLQYCLSEWL